jgi:putative N-acetylmannosamine-6-phosphate epimerase
MPDNSKFIEVKVYRNGIYPSKAKQIIKQGVVGVISGGKISDNAKIVFDKAGIWYRDNVEPSDLECEIKEGS